MLVLDRIDVYLLGRIILVEMLGKNCHELPLAKTERVKSRFVLRCVYRYA